jgi:shikimate dehydrogenase
MHAKLICLIGDPVEHSISPIIHNEVFRALNLNYVYLAFRVLPEDLMDAVRGLRALGVVGFNVTIPHKVSVMKYLDELSPDAEVVGSVNTVVNRGGRLVGYNTDYLGVVNTFKNLGIKLEGTSATVLGAGGASRAVIYALVLGGVERVFIVNRTLEKAVSLAGEFSIKFPNTSLIPMSLTQENLREAIQKSHIVINTTSVGMYPRTEESLVPPDLLRSDLVVMDVVYNPLETKLLRDAKAVGAKVVDGVNMLVYQAVASFKLWTGIDPPVDMMFRTAYSVLRQLR